MDIINRADSKYEKDAKNEFNKRFGARLVCIDYLIGQPQDKAFPLLSPIINRRLKRSSTPSYIKKNNEKLVVN